MKEINKIMAQTAKKIALAMSAIGLVAAPAMTFTGCLNSTGTTTNKCQDVTHAIDDNCGEAATVYGTVNGISIYRTKAVTDAQMAGVVAKIQDGYDMTSGMTQAKIIPSKVNAIWVDNADGGTDLGSNTWVIKVNFNNNASEMRDMFDGMASLITMQKLNDGIRLASQFDNSKETVRLSMASVRTDRTA